MLMCGGVLRCELSGDARCCHMPVSVVVGLGVVMLRCCVVLCDVACCGVFVCGVTPLCVVCGVVDCCVMCWVCVVWCVCVRACGLIVQDVFDAMCVLRC